MLMLCNMNTIDWITNELVDQRRKWKQSLQEYTTKYEVINGRKGKESKPLY